MALLQSNPSSPAEQTSLHCFPGWPLDWDASFTLAARGGFAVTASIQSGVVRSLQIHSKAGSTCRLRNPYLGTVRPYRDGQGAETLNGSLLEFTTKIDETITIIGQSD